MTIAESDVMCSLLVKAGLIFVTSLVIVLAEPELKPSLVIGSDSDTDINVLPLGVSRNNCSGGIFTRGLIFLQPAPGITANATLASLCIPLVLKIE